MSPRVPRNPRLAATIVATVVLLSACQPDGGTVTRTSGPEPVAPEAGVIRGRVTTETGSPVAGARLRIVGYTGGAGLGRDIETVTSAADGTYRYEVPRGQYEVLGDGPLEYDGQTYLFHLDPADGACDQALSDNGIVEDFVLRLHGLMQCLEGVDPNNADFYHGATVQAFSQLSGAAADDVVEYVFEPVGALADGSAGETLTMRRTVAAHSNFFGPLDGTSALHDIPLGRYEVTASLVGADGSRSPLLLSTLEATTPAESVEVTFDPRLIVETLSVGYSSSRPAITVHEGNG